MSDNIELNAATTSGSTLWTDEVTGSKHAQVVKLADGTADSTTVIAAGGGVEASALRVTIASDSTGVVSIDDNGGSITVDGTVAATQSGTWNVGTVTTVTAVTSITNTVTVSGTVTANLSAVDNAVLDDIAAKLGTIDADTSTLAAAVSTEMQVDVVAALPAGTNLLGKVSSGIDGTNLYDGTTALTIKRASGIATGSGANTLIAAVADKKIRVLALSLLATSTTAVSAYVYNGDYMLLGDGTNKLTLDMDGGGGPAGVVLPFNAGGWFQTDTNNEALAINLSGATPVIWCATYVEV